MEYLEDIIGSAKYVPLIEAKEVEVEKLNDSRGEVLNRVKVIICDEVNYRLLRKNGTPLKWERRKQICT